MDAKTGGPAFPPHAESSADEYMGMTLRDYFAAKAMQGALANSRFNGDRESLAKIAYAQADEMLKARES